MKPAPEGWKNIGVMLPDSVIQIIQAAGGDEPSMGGMPYAMASILGALPWIAVALYKEVSKDEYEAFAKQVKSNMQQAWEVIGAPDPSAMFNEIYERAKKSVN